MNLGRIVTAIVCLIAVTAMGVVAPRAGEIEPAFTVRIDTPTVKVGEPATIVATIAPRDGFRVTESYRHRIVNVAATDDGLDVARTLVRGSVVEGQIVFRVDVVAKRPGAHLVIGVFRFSINDGHQLDIKAAPFEVTVTATD